MNAMTTLNANASDASRPDDAQEEAARALQTALDRRDNGGRTGK